MLKTISKHKKLDNKLKCDIFNISNSLIYDIYLYKVDKSLLVEKTYEIIILFWIFVIY